MNYLDDKDGGLVTYLIQRNRINQYYEVHHVHIINRNPMLDSIRLGYVDMIDLFIE